MVLPAIEQLGTFEQALSATHKCHRIVSVARTDRGRNRLGKGRHLLFESGSAPSSLGARWIGKIAQRRHALCVSITLARRLNCHATSLASVANSPG
jgi:hypothetical protein